jgi:predicted glutamine amidotransferase
MCRILGYCASDDVSVADLVGEANLDAFTALSAWHRDGWGMAAHDGAGHDTAQHGAVQDGLRVVKSPLPACDDPDYQRLAQEPLGDTGLVHLRWATPGLAVEDRNSHPFTYGGFALAHNGAIHPQDRLPELLPPEWEHRLTSGTDSERYFLHIMSGLDAYGGDVLKAVTETVRHIREEFTPNSLNAILLAPDALYAIAWHNPELIPVEAIRARNSPEVPELYFNLAYRQTAEGVVVASTGWPQEGWTQLPNGSVLVVDRATRAIQVQPLLAGEFSRAAAQFSPARAA